MKATIVYDCQIFLSQRYGGISRYFYELASHFAQSDQFSTTVLAPLYVNQYLKKLAPQHLVGYPIPEIARTVRLRATINRGISSVILKKLCPDLVHETYYSLARISSKKAKTVITIHDLIHEKFGHAFPPSDLTALYKKRAIQQADAIICVSENTRQDLLERFDINPQTVFVTHLGCSIQPMPQKPLIRGESLRPYILYVGHRGEYKNFSRLLEAYAHSKHLKRDFSLVCFGGLPFSQAEREQFSKHKLLPEQVQYIRGDDVMLSALYTHASAFIYPSLYEGFGIAPLEAMSCNCPVVCSDRSSIPEVVGDAAAFFDPDSPESITDAIEGVLYAPERTQALIQLGKQRVKRFSWESCARQTADIYTSLL
ncbi:MAG: glycosyltransferase family 4 protein [Lyngbya sp. HA4199-MV5]|jgi:glycosyltransferase involved in cell wall biosynthesis|nr:glycosyltransferase family 4 protein [Lyngbya sp. HA4199-MV5]